METRTSEVLAQERSTAPLDVFGLFEDEPLVAVAFLKEFFAGCDPAGCINLRFLKDIGTPTKIPTTEWLGFGEIEARLPGILERHLDKDAYFGVNPRKHGDGTEAGITQVIALHADLDFKAVPEEEALRRVCLFPCPPTFAVISGGGLHLYWFLREALDPESIPLVKELNARIAAVLGADPTACDAARILRIPGTLNLKYLPPREVKVFSRAPENRYNLGDFDFLPPLEGAGGNGRGKPAGWQDEYISTPPRERHAAMVSFIASLVAKKLPPETVRIAARALRDEWARKGKYDHPFTDEEIESILENRAEKEQQKDRAGDTKQNVSGREKQKQGEGVAEKEAAKAERILKDFDKRFWKIRCPSCVYDIAQNIPIPHQHNQAFYRESLEHHVKGKKGGTINLYSKWISESPNSADKIDYRPDLAPYSTFTEEGQRDLENKVLNTFSGFLAPNAEGSCALFLAFIHDVVASGDDDVYAWVLQWMARIVQAPTDRVHAYALALAGPQGIGKTFFFNSFGRIFGANYIKLEDVESLLAFNSQIQSRVLVYLEECVYTASQRQSNLLKDLITGETVHINMKHITPFWIKNFLTLGSGTNNIVSAPVEIGDRRWVCLKLSDSRKEDHPYFAAIQAELDAGGYGALMHHLMNNVKLNFEHLDCYPKTEAYMENQRAWLGQNRPVFAFLRAMLDEHRAAGAGLLSMLDAGWIPSGQFNERYSQFLTSTRNRSIDGKIIIPQLMELFKEKDRDRVYKRRRFGEKVAWAYCLGSIAQIEEAVGEPIGERV